MKRIASGLAVVAAVACFATSVQAVDVNFHNLPNTFSCPAAAFPSDLSCAGVTPIDPNGTPGGANCMVLLTGIPQPGAAAVAFGIDFSSSGQSDATFWAIQSACGLAIPSDGPNGAWPSSGSGISIAFGECVAPFGPDGFLAVALLARFGPGTGTMSVIPDPLSGQIAIADCTDTSQLLDDTNGIFGFNGGGSTACMGPVPTEEATWGQIKAMF